MKNFNVGRWKYLQAEYRALLRDIKDLRFCPFPVNEAHLVPFLEDYLRKVPSSLIASFGKAPEIVQRAFASNVGMRKSP